MTLALVAIGAGLGAAMRYGFALLFDALWPSGTIAVNWIGSFLLGLLVGAGLDGGVMSLLGAGFCGGLTTYSAFAVQTHERGPRLGTAVAVLTLLPTIALCAVGFWVGQA
ncbi:MAG TPA: CrcB family protein [Nocardioides sp.]|nr:CrcB family protein [uncultured Nocardioides sp.]HEX5988431.1 CrcB family protein [Nocardioides sp.]